MTVPVLKPLKKPPMYEPVQNLGNGVTLYYSKQTKYYLAMKGDRQLADGESPGRSHISGIKKGMD